MAGSDSAYAGLAGLDTPQGEWNRWEFAIRMVMSRSATATLVQVKAVTAGPTAGEPPRVDVQPLVSQTDGAGNGTPHGTVHDLPCFRYQAGGSAVIIDPVVGDIGLAVFAHTDISSVKATRKAALPGSRRRFDYADGVYLGALLGAEPTSFVRFDANGAIAIQSADGQPVAIVAPGGVNVTTDGEVTVQAQSASVTADTVSLSGDLDVQGNLTVGGDATVTGALSGGAGSSFAGKSFDTHKHSGVSTGGGTSGPPV